MLIKYLEDISDISSLSFKIKNVYADINTDKARKVVITSKKMLFNGVKPINKIKIFNKYAEILKLIN